LVGAGTHPGAGIPGVVNSAKATASVILRDYAIEPPGPPRKLDARDVLAALEGG
jgi:hypothetical protein